MKIEVLGEKHLPSLLQLYTHLHDESYEIDGICSSAWNEILAAKNIVYFGGFVDEVLVSSCHLVVVPNLTRSCHPYALIENVVTHSEYRNKGYGKAILQAATDYAWEKECYKVMLMTGRKEESVSAFYRAAGFNGDEKHAFIIRHGADS